MPATVRQKHDRNLGTRAVARHGNINAFKILLTCGARLNIIDSEGHSPCDCVPRDQKSDFEAVIEAHYKQQAVKLLAATKKGNYAVLQHILLKEETKLAQKTIKTAIQIANGNKTEGHRFCLLKLLAIEAQPQGFLIPDLDNVTPTKNYQQLAIVPRDSPIFKRSPTVEEKPPLLNFEAKKLQ